VVIASSLVEAIIGASVVAALILLLLAWRL
jgi:hypothetical protein